MASGTLDVDSAPIKVHAFACNEVRLLIACLAYQMMHIARRVFAKVTGTCRSLCERVLRAGARLVCQSASNIEQVSLSLKTFEQPTRRPPPCFGQKRITAQPLIKTAAPRPKLWHGLRLALVNRLNPILQIFANGVP